MVGNILKYFRTSEWVDSKVPFMLSTAVYLHLMSGKQYSNWEVYAFLFAYFIYISMFLAFSYVINDYTDMDVDKLVGKKKVMHNLPKSIIVFSMILMVIVGVLPLLILVEGKVAFIVFTTILYILGAAYSVPILFRFKERGFLGLIECSVAQKCLPLIPIMFMFNVDWTGLIFFIVLSFVNGLRYIVIHQAIDYENDIKSGVKTFVSEGHNRYKVGIVLAFVTECILLIIIFFSLSLKYHFVLGVVIVYCIFEKIISIVVIKYMNVDWFCTFLTVPLESLYNVFFPVLMGLILTLNDYRYIICLIFLILLTSNCFKGKLAFVNVWIKSKIKK